MRLHLMIRVRGAEEKALWENERQTIALSGNGWMIGRKHRRKLHQGDEVSRMEIFCIGGVVEEKKAFIYGFERVY